MLRQYTYDYLAIFKHRVTKVFAGFSIVASFDVAMDALHLAWSPQIFKSVGLVWKAKVVLQRQ